MQLKKIFLFISAKENPICKLIKFINFIHRYSKPKKLRLYPIKLQIELTNKCNFNCRICARHWMNFKLGSMKEELIQKIKRVIPKISELVLFGYGESLLHSKFFELVREAKKMNKRISFFTNGALITEKKAKKLVQNEINIITFSIDAATKKTFRLIRKNSNFDIVIRAIESINKFKKEYDSKFPELEINFVITKQNVKELPDLLLLASKMGIRRVELSYLIMWSEKLLKYSPFELNINGYLEEAQKIAKKEGILLDIPHTTGNKLNCDSPWKYAYIRWDGVVQACCFSDKLVMGNLNESEFDEIWNNKRYQILRRKIRKKDYPSEDCKTCIARLKNLKIKNLGRIYLKTRKREKY